MALHTGTVGPVIRADNMEPEVLRQLVSILSGARDGIMHGTDFAVTQNGGGAMSVLVSSGFLLVTGTDSSPVQGQYHAYNDASVTVTVPTSNPSNPRIDLICATIEDAYYAGGVNSVILQDVAGTPAASPTVPATPADSLVLAHIYVGTGVASILTANINGTTGTNNPDATGFVPMRCEGVLGTARPTGGTSTATSAAIVAGMNVVVNVPAGRNIKISYALDVADSAIQSFIAGSVCRDGVGTVIDGLQAQTIAAANDHAEVNGVVLDQPAAGIHTYSVSMFQAAAGTMTFTANRGRMIVEDVGPV